MSALPNPVQSLKIRSAKVVLGVMFQG
jgi:hypothetical protein